MRPNGPHEELITAENERFTATLTPKAWRLLAVKAMRVEVLKHVHSMEEWRAFVNDIMEGDETVAKGMNGPELLYHVAMQTSGSMGGEARKDLVRAIKGPEAPPQTGVSINLKDGATPPAEGAPPRSGLRR
jgi:hypothetical protein